MPTPREPLPADLRPCYIQKNDGTGNQVHMNCTLGVEDTPIDDTQTVNELLNQAIDRSTNTLRIAM